jgi:hypothetical protein
MQLQARGGQRLGKSVDRYLTTNESRHYKY